MQTYAQAPEVFSRLFPDEKNRKKILEYFFLRLKEALFDEAKPHMLNARWEKLLEEFLPAYEEADALERAEGKSFLARYPLRFLTKDEIKELESPREYLLFHHAFTTENIYLLLKLDRDLHGFSTLEHILGVHHLAMKIARDLLKVGIPVDLGLLSGAAAGHDLGKYGVKEEELARIAYYHYYYSDLWFARRGMEKIRNIAVNHSTWDLEPESLSLESLLLIYSDFRVKNDASGQMCFYTLEESFQVILDKLDDVDEKKERRYLRVYNKLVDFEKYLLHQGINVDPEGESEEPPQEKDPALRFGHELVEMIHLEGVRESTKMMHLLRSEESISRLFEEVLSKREPEDILRLLETLSEYSIYLTPSQKRDILRYLQGLVLHSSEDVRRQCSALRGQIIGEYDIVYRKEMPPSAPSNPMEKEMLALFEDLLYEQYKPYPLMSQEKVIWLTQGGYRSIVRAMERQPENASLFMEPLLRVIMRPADRCRRHLSYRILDGMLRRNWLTESETTRWVNQLLEENPETEDFHRTLYFNVHSPAFDPSFREEGKREWEERYAGANGYDAQRMYLDNLKTDTPEDVKAMSLEYLCRTCVERRDPLHLSLHMLNLIRVSASRPVRRFTFNLVGRIIPLLTKSQLNDVSVELLGAIANEDPQSREFLCDLYGQLLARLSSAEREEILEEIEFLLKTSAAPMRNALVKAVSYGLRSSLLRSERVDSYLRVLFVAMVHAGGRTEQLALVSLANQVFRQKDISLEDKAWVFSLIVKKVRLLSKAIRSRRIAGLSYSYYLGSVYGFVGEYEMNIGPLELPSAEKIAIYPGAFDPMNLGQKRIVQRLADQGYEVYILLNEFAWTRRLYPYAHRRVIASINIAPILNAYLLPSGYSFLADRKEDREQILRDFFPSDITLLGERDEEGEDIRIIDVQRLRKEDHSPWMRIRPSMIRYAIREGLDTTEMLDPLAARYISRYHLYLSAQHEKIGEPFSYVCTREEHRLQVQAKHDPKQVAYGELIADEEGILHLTKIEDTSLDPLRSMFSLLLSEAVFLASVRQVPKLRMVTKHPTHMKTLKSLGYRQEGNTFTGDFTKPLVMIEDLPVRLQQDLREDATLRLAIAMNRQNLQEELTRLYPQTTIVSIPYSMLYGHILRMIEQRGKEDLLLVPISDIFYGQHFGKRRTKSLHLLGEESRGEDHYLSLEHQLEVLSKFDVPLLFIDDAAELSQDLLPLLPLIRKQQLQVAGLLSGLATPEYKRALKKEGVEVISQYSLPAIRSIFFESDFFPFFGGRSIKTTSRGFQRSRNYVYPLNGPSALSHPEGDFLLFSRRVLHMGRDLMEALEKTYRLKYGRALHVEDLFRVFDIVRVPEIITIHPRRRALKNYDQLIQTARSLEERWEGS